MRCGWDLGDLYRDQMTVRQLLVRYQALPDDAPLWEVVRKATEQAQADQHAVELDATLTRYRRSGGRP